MKISTNSSLNNRKQNWIDFNCGTLVEGDTLPELAEKLFDEVIAVASGKEECLICIIPLNGYAASS